MIKIYDNNYDGLVCCRREVVDLLHIANKPIRQICEEDESLLIYPLTVDDTDDRIGDSHIIDIYAEDDNSVRLKSDNIMGFVGIGNQQLKIYSRFDEDKNDYFLHYMLQKVFSYNIFNLESNSSNENVFDILMFMFPALLKEAMKNGVYKDYQRFQHNDSNVRGTIDVERHIRENIPFRGTIAYNTRDFSYDNSVMELIRHTIEYIRTTPRGETILSLDEVIEGYVKDVISYTPLYRPFDRIKIIRDNTYPRVHPFFLEYVALQKLCVQILNQEEIKYGDNDNRINGMLFDGAWLWEEYLNVLLHDLGFRHPENKLGIGTIYLFEHGGQRFPDFWKDNIVLEAKYKRLAQNGSNKLDINRDDIHQIMAYMYRLRASKGGIICPYNGEENKIKSEKMHKDSYRGELSLYALAVPSNCKSYSEFVRRMKKNEIDLLKAIM